MAYDGSCHCGAVTFSVEGDAPTQALSCNCSICRRKGMLLAFAPRSSLTLRGEESLASYLFNTHRIEHRFCTTCGVEPFALATAPDGTPSVAINLRCVPAIDLEALEIQRFDGASR
ncbi:GFA family protein [Roseomonas sp. JC162]|uniref:GFA family protein n=1 Tax=Neoroseomonas marina TaxID=1232220 RepID=A0A848EK10_9PROT|nr:GFA family protein [Neoroseomonas marina]NMJ43737.1 GFA family protein [Neoroseomonas marina]